MQTLVTLNAGHPDNHVVGSIRGGDPGRAATGLRLTPGKHDLGRICRGNFIGPHRVDIVMKTNIRCLTGVVRDS